MGDEKGWIRDLRIYHLNLKKNKLIKGNRFLPHARDLGPKEVHISGIPMDRGYSVG